MHICSFLIFIFALIGSGNALLCSQCSHNGQNQLPPCTVTDPQPTLCTSGSVYCLNNTIITANGVFSGIDRSCVSSLPPGFASATCYTASAALVTSTKCVCEGDGCNLASYQPITTTVATTVPPSNVVLGVYTLYPPTVQGAVVTTTTVAPKCSSQTRIHLSSFVLFCAMMLIC